MIDDRETAQRILELTAELKQRALALAKPDQEHIRIRAREIWEENGRPSGRDQEFWYQAEREFREAEALAIHAVEDTRRRGTLLILRLVWTNCWDVPARPNTGHSAPVGA